MRPVIAHPHRLKPNLDIEILRPANDPAPRVAGSLVRLTTAHCRTNTSKTLDMSHDPHRGMKPTRALDVGHFPHTHAAVLSSAWSRAYRGQRNHWPGAWLHCRGLL